MKIKSTKKIKGGEPTPLNYMLNVIKDQDPKEYAELVELMKKTNRI